MPALACPKCGANLSFANAPQPGQKVRCAKCKTVFPAPAAAHSRKRAASTAKAAPATEDPFVDEDPFVAAPATPSRGRRRRRSRRSVKLPLILVGSVIALIAVGLGVTIVVKNLPEDLSDSLNLGNLSEGLADTLDLPGLGMGEEIDFTYMPPETRSIVLVRPRARWQSAISRELWDPDESAESLADFEEQVGFPYTNVETVTVFQGPAYAAVKVVELTEEVDHQHVVSRILDVESIELNGRTYYRWMRFGAPVGLLFVSESTLLIADESIIRAVIDGTFTRGDSSPFAFVDANGQAINATPQIDRDRVFHVLSLEFPFLVGETDEFQELCESKAVAASGAEQFGSSAEYRQSIKFADGETAQRAQGALEELIANARVEMAQSLAEFTQRLEAARNAEGERVERAERGENPFFKLVDHVATVERQQLAEQHRSNLIDACRVSRSGSTVTIAMRLSREELDHQNGFRKHIVDDEVLPMVRRWLGWAPQEEKPPSEMPEWMKDGAPPRTTHPSNERHVVEFTYDIQQYLRRPDTRLDEEDIEQALLRVGAYVPESKSLNVAQAQLSFQLTDGYHNHEAERELKRMGLVLVTLSVQQEQLTRVVPERVKEITQVELRIVDMRPGVPDRVAAAEQSLSRMYGYVPGSVVIDEQNQRFTADFTAHTMPAAIIALMRSGPGLTLESTEVPTTARPPASGNALYLSLYYEDPAPARRARVGALLHAPRGELRRRRHARASVGRAASRWERRLLPPE